MVVWILPVIQKGLFFGFEKVRKNKTRKYGPSQ